MSLPSSLTQEMLGHVQALVVLERFRAHALHGDNSMESRHWSHPGQLPILVEEVGEVARALNELALGRATTTETLVALRDELVQVSAMAQAWLAKCEFEMELISGVFPDTWADRA